MYVIVLLRPRLWLEPTASYSTGEMEMAWMRQQQGRLGQAEEAGLTSMKDSS